MKKAPLYTSSSSSVSMLLFFISALLVRPVPELSFGKPHQFCPSTQQLSFQYSSSILLYDSQFFNAFFKKGESALHLPYDNPPCNVLRDQTMHTSLETSPSSSTHHPSQSWLFSLTSRNFPNIVIFFPMLCIENIKPPFYQIRSSLKRHFCSQPRI